MPIDRLHRLEQQDRVHAADLLALLPDISTPQLLEEVGYLMDKTVHDETLARAFMARAYDLGLDTAFAQAYINTMLARVPSVSAKSERYVDALHAGLNGAVIPPGGA